MCLSCLTTATTQVPSFLVQINNTPRCRLSCLRSTTTHLAQVAAAPGLGQAHGARHLSRHQRREVLVLQLFRAVHHERVDGALNERSCLFVVCVFLPKKNECTK